MAKNYYRNINYNGYHYFGSRKYSKKAKKRKTPVSDPRFPDKRHESEREKDGMQSEKGRKR